MNRVNNNTNKNNQLIPYKINENNNIVVSGRDLRNALHVKQHYTDWFKNMNEAAMLEENIDFFKLHKNMRLNGKTYHVKDVAYTLEAAKEIAMLQHNEIGKKVRKYFIDVDNDYKRKLMNQPKDSYMIEDKVERAERWIQEENTRKRLAKENAIMKPKAELADSITRANHTISLGTLSLLVMQAGFKDMGRTNLCKYARKHGLLMNGTKGQRQNRPTSLGTKLGLFREVYEYAYSGVNGQKYMRAKTVAYQRAIGYFIKRLSRERSLY